MQRLLLLIILFVLLSAGGFGYLIFFAPNLNDEVRVSIKIPTRSTFEDVIQLMRDKNVLKNENTFLLVAQMKKYPFRVKPGYYIFTRNMNNRQIVNMLMAGLQTPVKLVIYDIRTKEQFAALVGRTLEIDSGRLLSQMNDVAFCRKYDVDTNTIVSRIIVANYEFYWNTSVETFWAKMEETYSHFWNQERLDKAKALNRTRAEITTLASIVEKEVMRDKEMPTVAGVYLNRLRIGMALQADPTLVFALRDFEARRVTMQHKLFDSPYNTYMYGGLPPGPICMPRPKSIDAVLNYEPHKYLYFCANPDMSGYSVFSETYEQQMRVAAKYRKKLDEMNIR